MQEKDLERKLVEAVKAGRIAPKFVSPGLTDA